MKRKNESQKVIRIPIMVPVAIIIVISIIATVLIGKELITNAARYTAVNALTTGDGRFEYTELEDGTIEITSYKGTETNVTIPKTINGNIVTSIGNGTFEYNTSLTSVEIPEGVTNIGNDAFLWCSNLASIEIPKGVISIGESAFDGCWSLTNIYIPESVTSIGTGAFAECGSLVEINVSTNNEKYSSQNGILFNKENTKLIHYPAVKTDTKYTIPEGVTSIDAWAFSDCWNLTEIEISKGVTSIGDAAFAYCSKLTSIKISEGVETIGKQAFLNCQSLATIEFPSTVIEIGKGAFEWCTSLTNIEIPKGVTTIEYSTFSGCTSLSNVTIPEGVTTISFGAFSNCTSLNSIVLPESLCTIYEQAFYATNLSSVEIPKNVDFIQGDVFRNCTNLKSINVSVENTAYKSVDGVLFDSAMTEMLKYPEGKEDAEYEIPNGITSIGECAFEYCTNLKSVVISEGVLSIGYGAFRDCTSLVNIVIPEGVTGISIEAFANCTSLENLEILTTEADISNRAFNGAIISKVISTKEMELPDVIKRAMNEDDILYSDEGFELTNCSLNENKTKLVLDEEMLDGEGISLYVNSGALYGLSLVVFESGTITYSTTERTEGSVIATLHIEEGATITNNNGENTYIFTENGEFTFEYVDVDGNAKTATAKVRNIGVGEEIEITSEKYDIDDLYISKISPNATVEYIKEQLETNATEIHVYNKDGELQGENVKLATGMKIELNLNDEMEIFTLVVQGDTNGDGKADFKDLTKINSHRLNKKALEDEYLLAADVNDDGVVDFKDLVKVNKYRLNKITEL